MDVFGLCGHPATTPFCSTAPIRQQNGKKIELIYFRSAATQVVRCLKIKLSETGSPNFIDVFKFAI
jgi:hypothetical protein